jgi:predicted DNA-binding transcriptional regulator AlpA
MTVKSVLIQLSGNDLETLIFDCVDRAIKLNYSSTGADLTDEVGGIELAQQVTRLSYARIYTLVSKRKLPHKKRGNRLTFRRSELLKWLDEGTRAEQNGELTL